MKIKKMSYEECREDFFVKLIKQAENKIKYWKRQKGYHCEIDDNLANAGAEIKYCQDALKAFKKQIPKKPRVNDDNWFCCRNCGETFSLVNSLNKRNKYCGKCGQALDWGDS